MASNQKINFEADLLAHQQEMRLVDNYWESTLKPKMVAEDLSKSVQALKQTKIIEMASNQKINYEADLLAHQQEMRLVDNYWESTLKPKMVAEDLSKSVQALKQTKIIEMASNQKFNYEDDLLAHQQEMRLVNNYWESTLIPKMVAEDLAKSVQALEQIQMMAGTRPLDKPACLADLDDTSNIEQEAVGLMRHLGFKSLADGSLGPLPTEPMKVPERGILKLEEDNPNRPFPLIMDPAYFEPGRKRRPRNSNNGVEGGNPAIAEDECE